MHPIAHGGIRRRVDHMMGMPISLALRGRHTATAEGQKAWQEVINQLREVDQIFSTYRDDSIINRLDRGELLIDECPPEVAEVLNLGRQAQRQPEGAFSINLPLPDGRRPLDPRGVVKGWVAQRAARFVDALDETDYCSSAGGDLVCHTADPVRPAWRIGIENPHDTMSLIATVLIRSGAVATSGTTHGGRHLVDPRTGQKPSGVASGTALADSLAWVDIDATAAYGQGRHAVRWARDSTNSQRTHRLGRRYDDAAP
jgi:thiamine biosynthesis lipoprotein